MCIITLFSDCFCHVNTFFVELLQTALQNCRVMMNMFFFRFTKSGKIKKIIKISKRKAQTVSYDDAVADILNWVENPHNAEHFELETNKFSDDSDDSYKERNNIQSEQEEEIEEPHVSRHRKILTSSRLVHSIDSV